MGPDTRFLWSAGSGVALVLVFGALRLRFPRFPLHPVMFLVWNTYAMWMFSYSFLLGWLVKRSVTRYGGRAAYRQTTRFMFGVIVGDLLGGLIFMIISAVYYYVMGVTPTTYRVFPS